MARAVLGFMAREMQAVVADDEWLDEGLVDDESVRISFIAVGQTNSDMRIARRITYEQSGAMIVRREQSAPVSAAGGGYMGQWQDNGQVELATGVEFLRFYAADPVDAPYTTNLPRWVRIVIGLSRSDDVSGLGASSAGPDGVFDTDDDIKSW